jgi:hypothetical protein
MNILILVGIFFIALVAIVAAALLVMGERGAESNAGNSAITNPAAIPAAASGAGTRAGAGRSMPTIPLSAQASDATDRGVAPSASVLPPMTRTFPSLDRERFPLTEAQEEPDSLNGQFHELSAELRTLQTRAREMEQRISTLMEIVDRIERDQDGLLDIGIDSES